MVFEGFGTLCQGCYAAQQKAETGRDAHPRTSHEARGQSTNGTVRLL
jgi:hypothetical protein